jgi:hypothetical protein
LASTFPFGFVNGFILGAVFLPAGKESLEQNFLVTLLLLGFYLAIVSRRREITVLASRLEAADSGISSATLGLLFGREIRSLMHGHNGFCRSNLATSKLIEYTEWTVGNLARLIEYHCCQMFAALEGR